MAVDAPAVVVDYDSRWPADFTAIRDRIRSRLPPDATVEHVGSTAVPGLAAKPIIDVDIVVNRDGDVQQVFESLEALGYERLGDLGIPGREAFTTLPGLPYHHLYVVVDGSAPHRHHVELRDYLRTHPVASERYAAEKRRLAHLLDTDRDAYVQGKSWLVQDILTAARKSGPAPLPNR